MHRVIKAMCVCQAQEASPSGRPQQGAAPTRRALFAGRLQAADDWPVTASRNLDAPEMGSPRSSDEEDASSSGSSQVMQRLTDAHTILAGCFVTKCLLAKSDNADMLGRSIESIQKLFRPSRSKCLLDSF